MVEVKSYLTKNGCYLAGGKRIADRGVLIHDTATIGAGIDNFLRSWNTNKPNGNSVCVHAFSDNERVVNTLPYDMRCWGCGSGSKGSGNSYYVQIEMTVPVGVYFEDGWVYRIRDGHEASVRDYIAQMVEITAEWAAVRLRELGINDVNTETVTSHYEAHKMGIASNHGDPKGLLGLIGLTMDDFRDKVRGYMTCGVSDDDTSSSTSGLVVPGVTVRLKDGAVQFDGKPIRDGFKDKIYTVKSVRDDGRAVLEIDGIVIYAVNKDDLQVVDESYTVKVTNEALNIRSGPGTAYPVVGCIRDFGVYTIVADSGAWGKLKSGAGWIHLGYTRRV